MNVWSSAIGIPVLLELTLCNNRQKPQNTPRCRGIQDNQIWHQFRHSFILTSNCYCFNFSSRIIETPCFVYIFSGVTRVPSCIWLYYDNPLSFDHLSSWIWEEFFFNLSELNRKISGKCLKKFKLKKYASISAGILLSMQW